MMSGVQNDCMGSEIVLKENLSKAIPLLKEAGVVGLIEPINPYTMPNYFLNNYELGSIILILTNL